MDKAKGVLKGGWHPSGDPQVRRETWKSDLKGIATGKTPEKKQLEASRNHQSVPLSALKDPDSFAPPPKHTDSIASGSGTPTSATRPRPPAGGLGSPVPAPRRRQEEQEAQEEKAKAPPLPYRADTTGLSTNNLPKPPVRRTDSDAAPAPAPAPPPRISSPSSPALPVRPQQQQQQQPRTRPQPSLPPRMNDHPDEFTPPAPPSYNQATQPATQDPALLNPAAVNRLGQAGVSVLGFGIGGDADANPSQSQSNFQGHPGQLSELQQRFARMNARADNQPSTPLIPSSSNIIAAAAAAHKKLAPPPPPKKAGLANGSGSRPGTADGGNEPPPLPLSSKPRPS